MLCSARLDTISALFALHPTTLTDDSRSFSALAHQIDSGNYLPDREHCCLPLDGDRRTVRYIDTEILPYRKNRAQRAKRQKWWISSG